MNPPLVVALLGMLVFQGLHELEHVAQVVERFVLGDPNGVGLAGQVFDIEPLHLAANLIFWWLMLLVYVHSRFHRPDLWNRGMAAWWLLTLAVIWQGYHVVEHVVKIIQYVDTGRNSTPGILGNVFNLVWLHFTFNTVAYGAAVAGFFAGGFHRHFLADLRVVGAALVGRDPGAGANRRPPLANIPTLSRRGVLTGMLGVAAAVGAARFAAAVKNAPLAVPTFTDVTRVAGITFKHQMHPRADAIQAGVAYFDFDGDGRLDIFLTNGFGPNALYRNNGDGTFTDVAAKAGVADPDGVGIGVACADYDNDGHCDLLLTRLGGLRLFHNNGDGTFSDVTVLSVLGGTGGHPASAAWSDFDGDGYLDLYVTYWLDEMPPTQFDTSVGNLQKVYSGLARSHRLYHNNGNGTFHDVTEYLGENEPLGAGLAAGFFDYDDDGRPDLYVVNDFGMYVRPNSLYHNDGPRGTGWSLQDVSKAAGVATGINGMGVAFGDYDGDGRLDIYVTNMGSNVLYRNRGNGTFEEMTNRAGVGRGTTVGGDSIGWGPAFLDFDNDGLLDLYFVAGALNPEKMPDGQYPPDQPNALFQNRGDGTFRDVTQLTKTASTHCGRGLAVADFDGDGFLDLLIANFDQRPMLLKNSGNSNKWLDVRLVGKKSNRDGIGSRLTLTAGGRRQIREICSGTSFLSQHSLVAHFGLGQQKQVDELKICWPSGIVQTLTNLQVNRTITVTEAG